MTALISPDGLFHGGRLAVPYLVACVCSPYFPAVYCRLETEDFRLCRRAE
jgi:hypothetical protein